MIAIVYARWYFDIEYMLIIAVIKLIRISFWE